MTSYYNNTLYPLQDKVLQLVDSATRELYFTGGTALSRCYFHHRFSDDIDLFVNDVNVFPQEVERVIEVLRPLGVQMTTRTDHFTALIVAEKLKVDLVCDSGARIGQLRQHSLFSRVDDVRNILANKVTALLGRDEVKDVVDLWVIATNTTVDWRQIFTDAQSKAVGILPPLVAEKLATFPIQFLEKIQWQEAAQPDPEKFERELQQIISSMLQIEKNVQIE